METEPGKVGLLLHTGRERRWVRELAARLEQGLGQAPQLFVGGAQARPEALPFERLDRRIYGAPEPDLTDWFSTEDLPPAREAATAGWLLIDLTGAASIDRQNASLVLTPRVDGGKGSAGLAAALARCGMPYLSVEVITDEGTSELLGTSIAIPDRDSIPAFLNTLFARLITLLDAAVRHLLFGRALPLTSSAGKERKSRVGGAYSAGRKAKAFARSLAHRWAGHLVRTADWTVGYRRKGEGSVKQASFDPAGLHFVPCSYRRFYADPMLFTHEGRDYIFFEDYDYARRIGRLSCARIEEDGRCGEVSEVMSRPSHLSYPFVFAHEGEIYMVPETGAERRVELWRAGAFPNGWEYRSLLLDGVEAVDATLKHDRDRNRWWMFASVAEPGGSTYDTLSIFYADDLLGPWQEHALNPVKLDASCSRPAGPIVERDGAWLRPAQDSSRGYGSGLAWCRITKLTPTSFSEEVVSRWQPPKGYRGLHSYTEAGGWEAVDLQRRRWRWSRRS